ncbi:MAG: protein-export chaperone SecB [Pseudomonadota bacterium]
MSEETAAAGEEATQREVGLRKVYIKDFSFESPGSPAVFSKPDFRPNTNMNLRTSNSKVDDDLYEMVLTITLDAKQDDETAFLVELQQAGLFVIRGYDQVELATILGSFCPATLFPYAREVISSSVQRGGFPDLLLQPIDFDALFRRSQQEAAKQQAAAANNTH